MQRNDGRLTPAWAAASHVVTIVPADDVMARSHLRGIRSRAEHLHDHVRDDPAEPGMVA